MVKAKSPIFDKLSKGFKNLDVRLRKTGIEIGKKRVPFNPRTDAQKQHRAKYGQLVQQWNLLSPEEKESYNQQAKPLQISGWNLFVMQNLVVIPVLGWELVKHVKLDADQTSVDLDGLNLDADWFYLLVFNIKNPLGSGCKYFLFFNGNETQTDYWYQGMGADHDTRWSARENKPDMLFLGAGAETSVIGVIGRVNHPTYSCVAHSENIGSNINIRLKIVTYTKDENVTKITIKSETANGIGAGSKILLFKPKLS